jgi:hypothetical protein
LKPSRRAKDGRLVPISLTVSPIRDAQGTIIGASKVARDITDRIAAEETLTRVHDELEQRIRERTAELASSNQALRAEIAERQRVEQQRTQLLTRFVVAQEDERRRIAREPARSNSGQQLTALRLTWKLSRRSQLNNPSFVYRWKRYVSSPAARPGRRVSCLGAQAHAAS